MFFVVLREFISNRGSAGTTASQLHARIHSFSQLLGTCHVFPYVEFAIFSHYDEYADSIVVSGGLCVI